MQAEARGEASPPHKYSPHAWWQIKGELRAAVSPCSACHFAPLKDWSRSYRPSRAALTAEWWHCPGNILLTSSQTSPARRFHWRLVLKVTLDWQTRLIWSVSVIRTLNQSVGARLHGKINEVSGRVSHLLCGSWFGFYLSFVLVLCSFLYSLTCCHSNGRLSQTPDLLRLLSDLWFSFQILPALVRHADLWPHSVSVFIIWDGGTLQLVKKKNRWSQQ